MILLFKINLFLGAQGKAWQLRALATLAGSLGLIPVPMWWLTTFCNSRSIFTHFWSTQEPDTNWYIDINASNVSTNIK